MPISRFYILSGGEYHSVVDALDWQSESAGFNSRFFADQWFVR